MSLMWKLISLGSIILFLFIVLAMIGGSINEREYYRNQALNSVAKSWTSQQTLISPILVIPYEKIIQEKTWDKEKEKYVFQEKRYQHYAYHALNKTVITSSLDSQSLTRGIFDIPVYQANFTINGEFDFSRLLQLQSEKNIKLNQKPYLAIGVSDQRGLTGEPNISGFKNTTFKPGSGLSFNPNGFKLVLEKAIKEPLSLQKNKNQSFQLNFKLKGMTGIHFLPTSKVTQVIVNSDWPHPSFIGSFLPDKRNIQAKGYQAQWSTNYFSSAVDSLLNECEKGNCTSLQKLTFGVDQIEVVDHYLKSERSTKYGLLIILLIFASFILFEALKKYQLHPLHYFFVGLAMSIFYLLLTALSEHLSFAWSYLISALACTLLIWSYMSYQLGMKNSLGLLIGQWLLYSILYLIILSEDFAFISGAILSFTLLGSIMLITRKFDWFSWHEKVNKS